MTRIEAPFYQPIDAVGEPKKNYAFSLEYAPFVTDQEIKDDVVSYLAEYRLKIPEYTYELSYSYQKGAWGVRDSYRGDSMQEKTKRALNLRIRNGQSTHREEAELMAFERLDFVLKGAKEGDMLFWGSPPGEKEEGYGDYGFVYHGVVCEKEGGEKKLSMTAVRVDNAEIDEYNAFFSELLGTNVTNLTAEDYIANPVIQKGSMDDFNIRYLLRQHFKGLQEKGQDTLEEILYQLEPAIQDLVGHIRFSPQDTKEKALFAIENIALELKRRMKNNITTIPAKIRLADIIDDYGYEPPAERGSCGSTGFQSSDIFGVTLYEDQYGGRTFECPTCHRTNIRPEGELLSNCQHCGSNVAC